MTKSHNSNHHDADDPDKRANKRKRPPMGESSPKARSRSTSRSRAQEPSTGPVDLPFPPGWNEPAKPVTLPEMPKAKTMRDQIEQVIEISRRNPPPSQLRDYLADLPKDALIEPAL